MAYRDDTDALLARIDVQRRELAASRAEIERLRAQIADLEATNAGLSRKLAVWREHYQPPPALEPAATPGRGQLLFQIDEPGAPETRELRIDKDVIKIGRLASSHVLLGDPAVSRIHAVIEVESAGRIIIVDLGSPGGTRLNGAPITKSELSSGDLIEVGETRIRIYFGW